MKTNTIEVASIETVKQRMKAAFRGEKHGSFYTLPSHRAVWTTLNANRWAILQALTGAGPIGVRELARRVKRDVKGVHTDAQILVKCGVIDKTPAGKLSFPYAAVRVDFVLKAA